MSIGVPVPSSALWVSAEWRSSWEAPPAAVLKMASACW